MVKVKSDLTGTLIERLTVLRRDDDGISSSGKPYARWVCQCSCENKTIVSIRDSDLRYKGGTKSCGCLVKEMTIKANKRYNKMMLDLEDEHGKYGIGYCNNTGTEFYFDMQDYELIKEYCWREHISSDGYHALEAHEKDTRMSIRMHWLVVGKFYDHADRNPMNNRRYNLRPASAQENARNHNKQKNNTSGFIGVGWRKDYKKWYALITVNKKKIHLGYFKNKEDAIKARLEAEAKYFKDFAPQRHLFEQYDVVCPPKENEITN